MTPSLSPRRSIGSCSARRLAGGTRSVPPGPPPIRYVWTTPFTIELGDRSAAETHFGHRRQVHVGADVHREALSSTEVPHPLSERVDRLQRPQRLVGRNA